MVDPESPGVWGLVYGMDEGDLKVLDMFEGFQGEGGSNVYERRAVEVLEVGREDRPLKVFTYLVANGEGDFTPPSHFTPPSRECLSRIVRGARHWGLPEHYIQMLENKETT